MRVIPKIQINQLNAWKGEVIIVKIQEKMEFVNVEQMPLAQMTNPSARLFLMVWPNVRNAQNMRLVANLEMVMAQHKEIVEWVKFATLLENAKVCKDISFSYKCFVILIIYHSINNEMLNEYNSSMFVHSNDCPAY